MNMFDNINGICNQKFVDVYTGFIRDSDMCKAIRGADLGLTTVQIYSVPLYMCVNIYV